MEKNTRYFDIHRAKVYREIYRPSPNVSSFVKTVMTVLLHGQSPINKSSYDRTRKVK